jgi:cell division septal protein FtsQ
MWRRKKDYLIVKRHSGANPFVRTSDHPTRHIFFWISIFVLCMCVFWYLIITYPQLQISSVSITGTATVSSETIRISVNEYLKTKRWGILPQHSAVLFSKNGLIDYVYKQFNFLRVRVNRVGTTGIELAIEEQNPSVVIINDGQQLYLDGTGVVIRSEEYRAIDFNLVVGNSAIRKQVLDAQYPEVIYHGTIEGVHDNAIINQHVLDKNAASFIVQLHQALLEKIPNVHIAHYELQSASIDTLTMEAVDGWMVYFKINDQPSAQVERLKILLDQKIKNTVELDYVDLRYDDKVFYR